MIRIGIDLGGSKIALLALDSAGRERYRQRVPTPASGYGATLSTLVELVGDAERKLGEQGSIGVGTPGAISRHTGLIKNANSTCLNGQALKQDLENALDREVRIENDANCFALSEANDGAAAGARSVFGVILGTGTGGGIVVDGRPLVGVNAIAGEWGHNPLPQPRDAERPGAACYCGRRGCLETWLSGPGLAARFRERDGRALDAGAIVAAASEGDASAEAEMQDYEDRLARGLASIINVLDPDAIVLGGGLSNIERLYDNVPRLWAQYVFSDAVATRLLPPRFGDDSGVRGAAWLWNEPDGN